ncbi:hypothetical protein [Kineococcus sp. SYSU DK003]|uniref:hypothetical protein n=1 Tax=Kineococcus sp. SYSU DK003 TaxID=3383124 RepID=UPI003D7CCFFB
MPIPHRTDLPPVLTAADLGDRWRLLATIDPPPARGAELRVQVFDADGRQGSALIVVEDVPPRPDGSFVENLLTLLGHVVDDDTAGIGSVAFALVRAEPEDVQPADLSWAGELLEGCRRRGTRARGVHLVGAGSLTPLG